MATKKKQLSPEKRELIKFVKANGEFLELDLEYSEKELAALIFTLFDSMKDQFFTRMEFKQFIEEQVSRYATWRI